MGKRIMPVLMPDFYRDFHCAAAGCRNNCCIHPWNIDIDKKNYKKLRALKSPKWLAEHFGDYIMRKPASKSDADYAIMKYTVGGCPLQTEQGLCRLQMDLGAEYLCHTCQTYPRVCAYFVNTGAKAVQQECGLTISCEEVVRMLLLKPEPIEFVTEEEQYTLDGIESERRQGSAFIIEDGSRPMLAHYNLIRAVGIAILQNRDYSIEHRLMLLLLFLDKLSQAEADERTAEVPAIIDTFVRAIDERLYDPLLAASGGAMASTAMSTMAFHTVFGANKEHNISARCYANITAKPNQTSFDSYRAFTADKEYFLEHFLVMEFFGKSLPFRRGRSIFDCAQYMTSIFTIFRYMLDAYLGEAHTLPTNEFIDFVAYFGKELLHSESRFDNNIALLQNNGMNTLPHLMSIVLG